MGYAYERATFRATVWITGRWCNNNDPVVASRLTASGRSERQYAPATG